MNSDDLNELISVIIPVYNVEKYLGRCLDSIIGQTYVKLEIILVDDGSTDSSGQICEKYRDKDSRIQVIHQKNKGLAGARNTGIDIARGKYIFFIDSDDFVDITTLERLLSLINKTDADMAVGQYSLYFESKEAAQTQYMGSYKIYSASEALSRLNDWRNEETTSLITAWGTLYKRKLFEDIRYPEGKWHEDEFVTHRLISKAKKICMSEDSFYFYRQHEESFMSKIDSHSQIKHIVLFDALQERADFFSKNYPQLLDGAVHHILREANSFYDIFCKERCWRKDSQIKQAVKDIVSRYRKYYFKYWSLLNIKDKISGGIFCFFPGLYHKAAGIKWRY